MSTISGLLLRQPDFAPFDLGRTLTQATNIQGGQLTNQTRLLELAELQRQQEAQALARQYYQQHPEALLGGGSTLAALPTMGGPPPGDAITQQPFGPGGVGPAQTVPAYPDASRYAGVSPTGGGPIPPDVAAQVMPTVTPPQSTLGSLGPQPQARANPLEQLMRRNPDAAFAVMQKQQAMQEQQFKTRATVAEGIAVELQGATDQASYDAARQRVAQISPQWAQALPQVYSKEAVQPWIDRALGAKDKAVLDVQTMQTQVDAVKAQAELQKARMGGRVAKTDQYLKALGVAPGTETDVDMQKALAWQQRDEIAVSASHGSGQVVQTPDGMFRLRPGTDTVVPLYTPEGKALQPKPTQAEQETATFGNLAKKADAGATALETKGFKPGFWDTVADKLPLGMNNYLTSEDYQSYKSHVLDFAQAWLRKTSKGAVTEPEWQMIDKLYFPQPGNSQKQIEEKRQKRASVIQELEAETKGTGRTGTQGQPTSQAPSGGATRQGGATFTDADIAATLANPANKGKTRQQVMDAALAKGLTYKER